MRVCGLCACVGACIPTSVWLLEAGLDRNICMLVKVVAVAGLSSVVNKATCISTPFGV